MFNRYLIIDDFYSNPEEIVETALKSDRDAATPAGHEPGMLTRNFFLGQPLRELFQKLTLEAAIVSSAEANGRILFNETNPNPEFRVYCDSRMRTMWTGVIYLSPENPGVDGTCFWRHQQTGLDVAPTTSKGLNKFGWESFEALDAFMDREGRDESLWKKTLTVPYKFNRLVLFRPWQFHSHGPGFGDSPETCRIVQTLYFATQDPQQQW
jgi:hypothetical protein